MSVIWIRYNVKFISCILYKKNKNKNRTIRRGQNSQTHQIRFKPPQTEQQSFLITQYQRFIFNCAIEQSVN